MTFTTQPLPRMPPSPHSTNGPTTPQDIMRAAAQQDRASIQPGDALGLGLAGMPERSPAPPGWRFDEEDPTHLVRRRFSDRNDRNRRELKEAGDESDKKKAAKEKKKKKKTKCKKQNDGKQKDGKRKDDSKCD